MVIQLTESQLINFIKKVVNDDKDPFHHLLGTRRSDSVVERDREGLECRLTRDVAA